MAKRTGITKKAFVAQFEGQPVEAVLAAAEKKGIELTRKHVHRIRFVLRTEGPSKRKRRGVTKRVMRREIRRARGNLVGNSLEVIPVDGAPIRPTITEASAAASESFRSDPCNLCGHRRDAHFAGHGCQKCASEETPTYVPDHTFYKRDEAQTRDKRMQLRALMLDLGLDVARAVIQDLGASVSS